jgi:hypothetical protein
MKKVWPLQVEYNPKNKTLVFTMWKSFRILTKTKEIEIKTDDLIMKNSDKLYEKGLTIETKDHKSRFNVEKGLMHNRLLLNELVNKNNGN